MKTMFVRVLSAMMLLSNAAFAGGEMMVMNAVVQPPLVATNKVGVLYFTTMNHGAAADRLTAIESPAVEQVELHESLEENGIAKMRPVETLEIPAGTTIELKPGGLHAMLIGIKEPLAKGAKIAFNLKFEKAGDVAMEATVGDLASIHNHGATLPQ
jgi:hypothetical protein